MKGSWIYGSLLLSALGKDAEDGVHFAGLCHHLHVSDPFG